MHLVCKNNILTLFFDLILFSLFLAFADIIIFGTNFVLVQRYNTENMKADLKVILAVILTICAFGIVGYAVTH